ncbi:hypothetical protein [Lacticaseibacillus rhamnosus]|uniref:hypothetical protein n=1 Tax=Lacticaseibacillus rhamnosus TaxID=47715 RepID=UPI000532C428|nr:hypothetical protein [Lacticaseibacillus rhamnosus]
MTKETKQDVFDALMSDMAHGSEQWRTRYDAAPICVLPVLPKPVADCMEFWKDKGSLLSIFCRARYAAKHSKTEQGRGVWLWILNNQNDFAIAWVLGAWKVEETGEIVKLEAEK